MAARDDKRPTDAELEILNVLWDRGPSTVRAVYEALSESPTARGSGYTTVLKHMQIMVEKEQLVRDESVRPQIYRPARSRAQTQKQLLRHLVDRVFSGSAGNLVLAALHTRKATPDEQQRIRDLLDRLDHEEDEP